MGGVGFTMAIFVTNLAFVDPNMISMAKAAILAASLIAGVAGFFILRHVTKDEIETNATESVIAAAPELSAEETILEALEVTAKSKAINTENSGLGTSGDQKVEK